jgi:hypothetical protein
MRTTSLPPNTSLDDLTKLELSFREGLYAEYAGDYVAAEKRFQECESNPHINDPKGIWNGVPISTLVGDHLLRARSANQSYQYALVETATIAQSVESEGIKDARVYDHLKSAEMMAHEWDGTSLSSVYLGSRVRPPTLANDSKPLVHVGSLN